MIGLLKKPIRLNRTSKRISGNSLSPLEDRNKEFGEKGDLRGGGGGSAHQEKFSNLGAQKCNFLGKKKQRKMQQLTYLMLSVR